MAKTITIGKYRALQRATTPNGIFSVLAIDHQDALRRSLNPNSPTTVTDQEVIQFKHDVVSALVDTCSGVLLDPRYSAPQAIANNILGQCGLLVELEKADYSMEPMPLLVEILPQWSVNKIKQMNADGVKLFYYYNPDDAQTCQQQDALIANVAKACDEYDIPLYAEPIIYPFEQDEATFSVQRTRLILESAVRAQHLGADVLKLEFPLDVSNNNNIDTWFDACQQITDVVDVPWVLLSAGVDYDTFCRQVEVACKAGASGYIVGRAIWGEACSLPGKTQNTWLGTTAVTRMEELAAIATAEGTSWHELLVPEVVTTEWYQR